MPETRGASVFHHHESISESSIKNYLNKGSSKDMLNGSQETNIDSDEVSYYLCPSDPVEKKREKADQDKEMCNQVRSKENRRMMTRARRRQTTNSHSIAERLRRERISERMRFLQNLVPACTEVTGKALMLDEIINYVQSLQQQVEFLSMKLAAAAYPQQNYAIERLHAKNHHARDNTSLATGSPQEMLHPHLHPSQQDFSPTVLCNMFMGSRDQ